MKILSVLRFLFGILISICSLLYLLPTGIAIIRKRTNTGAIFVLNLFLGWMIIPWVIALMWSVATDTLNVKVVK